MKQWYVYCIVNSINAKRYIGKTGDIKKRWQAHCRAVRDDVAGSPHLHRAMRKYGVTNFVMIVLHETNSEEAAWSCERDVIAELDTRNPAIGYNIAEGGLGGHTMTTEMLDAQYAIKSVDYEAFREAYASGLTIKQIASLFDVGGNAVLNCAKRLGLSFQARRREAQETARKTKYHVAIQELKRLDRKRRARLEAAEQRMSPDEYTAFRADVARRVNKARAPSVDVQQQIHDLYFVRHMTAPEIVEELNVTRGQVRGYVNRTRNAMSQDERDRLRHEHGSAVRSSVRHPQYGKPKTESTRQKIGAANRGSTNRRRIV